MFRDPPAAPHQQPGGEPLQPQLLPGVYSPVAGAAGPGQDTVLATGKYAKTGQQGSKNYKYFWHLLGTFLSSIVFNILALTCRQEGRRDYEEPPRSMRYMRAETRSWDSEGICDEDV